MAKTRPGANADTQIKSQSPKLWKRIVSNRWLYLLALPGILYFILFKYVPMWGLLISFKKYNASLGFFASEWVGLKNFVVFFTNPDFLMLFRNTFMLALYNLVFFFPLPIVLALMLNSVRVSWYKRFVQTITYMPHFMSWVIIASICQVMLTTEGGIINDLIFGLTGNKIDFLTNPRYFRGLITVQAIWRETGWGTIIFLAALSNVDPQLYDAAHVDGANGWQRMWNITIPAITGTIITLLILRLGHFMDTGFSQIFLMVNSLNREVGEVFDTYVYRLGIKEGNKLSYTTAVGMFKSVVGLVLVVTSDRIAKKTGNEGIL
ncbi:MAG: ABC transporter permease subunit [Oscillospiraceae bacterium]|jgi:putative aldouronate transport system permease protein|nr:ABC transporter permease subunit [Oscillospiraceae bacterium]